MIGTELLLGQIVDTNASYLARRLAAIGVDVRKKTTVGDNLNGIASVIRNALEHSDIVITSGGIGPTVDDKTREAVAKATDQKLIMDPHLLRQIEAFFNRRGLVLGENNKLQAYVPENAIPIENPVSTAPAFIVHFNGSVVISLPGVPHELYYLTENNVVPYLRKEFNLNTIIKTRVLRTSGTGESNIDRMIGDLEHSKNPVVGLAAHPGSVDIRVSATADNLEAAEKILDDMEAEIRSRVGDIIFGVDSDTIEQAVVNHIAQSKRKLAVVETHTGGHLATRLTSVPSGLDILVNALVLSFQKTGARFFPGSTMNPELTEAYAKSLARQIAEEMGSDIGLAVIGDEDPDVGPFSEKTGNTYIGMYTSDHSVCRHIQIGGIAHDTRTRIINFAFEALRTFLTTADAAVL